MRAKRTVMRALEWVLKAKIALTAGAWCAPLLLFPANGLGWLGFPTDGPMVFLRLLGMAYLALVLGYLLGLRQLRREHFPWEVVWVGILSNSGACLILILAAVAGTWGQWGLFARMFMGASTWAAGLIALALAGLAIRQALSARGEQSD